MSIGFTGTSEGMTYPQRNQVRALLYELREKHREFHHGDCVGSDMVAALLASTFEFTVHAHPPLVERLRAFFPADVLHPAKDFMERNQDIVDSCNVLLATPRTTFEELRSGTWATVRRARKAQKRIIIVWPDGSTTEDL